MPRPGPGHRGEGYVAAQFVLLVLVIVGPTQFGGWPRGTIVATASVNAAVLVLVIAGVLLLGAGTRQLGANLTPLPYPKKGSTFVDRGIYRLVRHPLYGGLMLLAVGWSVRRGGGLALLYAGLLIALLAAKSRIEERWLVARYPDYGAYCARTKRFLPFVW